jgi:excinuclease ABC subunit A
MFVKCADWVIDLGKEGGDSGGQLVFKGTPEQMIQPEILKNSYTAHYLKHKM